METRVAQVADAILMADLHGKSFGNARWDLDQITKSLSLATTCAWIAEENEKPLGFIALQIVGDEAEILTFCVDPKAQRKSVGQNLLQTALNAASQKRVAHVFLEVAEDNQAALALYQKAHFCVKGKRARYYQHGTQAVDAVILSLDL